MVKCVDQCRWGDQWVKCVDQCRWGDQWVKCVDQWLTIPQCFGAFSFLYSYPNPVRECSGRHHPGTSLLTVPFALCLFLFDAHFVYLFLVFISGILEASYSTFCDG